MIDAHLSVKLAVAAERRRMFAEMKALRDGHAELHARLQAALTGLRQTRLEFLHLQQLIARDREQQAEINRTRQLTLAQLAERDPTALLQ